MRDPTITSDFIQEVRFGNIDGAEIRTIHGHNIAVPAADFVPLAIGGLYETPQVGSETKLRVKGGNAADTSSGAGARAISMKGIDKEGHELVQTVATNGASGSLPSEKEFLRMFDSWVSASGGYPGVGEGSHVGDIIIEDEAGITEWACIPSAGIPEGQSQIGLCTVPKNKVGYLISAAFFIETKKTASILGLYRAGILKTTPPYAAIRHFADILNVEDEYRLPIRTARGPFRELTDIGFLAKVELEPGEVTVDCELLIMKADTAVNP